MEIKKKVVFREVAGEAMLIPVGPTTSEFNGIFTLSPTAATAFKAVQNGADKEGALNAVLEEFDVDRETARLDLEEFFTSLYEFGII